MGVPRHPPIVLGDALATFQDVPGGPPNVRTQRTIGGSPVTLLGFVPQLPASIAKIGTSLELR